MRKQIKKFIKYFFLGIILLLLLVFLAQIFSADRRSPGGDDQTGLLTAYSQPRVFIVVAVIPNGYLAREQAKENEINIYMPSDAVINRVEPGAARGGSVLLIDKYLLVTGGLVAQTMTVLPPAPKDASQTELPSIPSVE